MSAHTSDEAGQNTPVGDRDRRVVERDPAGAEVRAGIPPAVRVDQARIDAPAPPREFSPAQALELVRRASRRTNDGDHRDG